MPYVYILFVVIVSSCNSKPKMDSGEQNETQVSTSTVTDSILNANNAVPNSVSVDSTFEYYYADNAEMANIQRPSKNVIESDIDTAMLFDIWTTDANGPHADFVWNADYFDVADYDGDSRMPYILKGRKLKVFYNDGIRYGELVSLTNDTMKIHWQEMDAATSYIRWRS